MANGSAPNPSPFSTIESALEFVELLQSEVDKTRQEMVKLMENDENASSRRVEAIRLVIHKLTQLDGYMDSSSRVLNDLKALRTLLLR